ncbi:MAG: hypothetical protein KF708_11495 [Pirellulales bacterium]|nr:hypothetical protein [Pirellulales bacterium]
MPNVTLSEVYRLLREHPRRWLVPTVAVFTVALVYAFTHPGDWEASQALIVRNEASNTAGEAPGKFRSVEDMKATQETILEIVRSRQVLTAALDSVGAPAKHDTNKPWPTAEDVETLRSAVKIAPPHGAEFGKTEIFYLKVKDASRERAVALATALCDQTQSAYRKLREDKAQGMLAELARTVDISRKDLNDATSKLSNLERQVGGDLAELRNLHGSPSAESDLRRNVTSLETDLRAAETSRRANEELLALLESAQHDPTRLVATPNRLLDAQPGLKRLKDGLIDAQLKLAQLQGDMSDDHPKVRTARNSVQEIVEHINAELSVAVRGVQAEIDLGDKQIASLQSQLNEGRDRLARLAGLRAEYSNLVAEVDRRTKQLELAERNQADARASQSAAVATSLITRVDTPDTGARTIGPRRSVIALAGLLGGFASGLGLLLLTVPLDPGPGPIGLGVSNNEPASSTSETVPFPTQVAACESRPAAGVVAAASPALSFKHSLAKLSRTYSEVR